MPDDNRGGVTPLSLLERARANDPDAWSRLVQLYRPLVAFWCMRGRIPASDVEDVAQETVAAAAAGLARFRHDRPGDTFRGWLRAITRNQVLLWLRRNHDRAPARGGSDAWRELCEVPDPLPGPGSEEDAEVGQLYRRALEQVRAGFEEQTWRAFWLTAIEDRSPAAISAELGMTPAAIRQAKSRVLRRLKDEMGDLLS
ncbi:MAG: sigma-70 family RNA polymerase sigma factor [Gemmataceae bacterium]